MQKRYIWLAGSYPDLLLIQGRGRRSQKTLYALDRPSGELVLFGYSDPCYFMLDRYFRRGQAPNSYILTEQGEEVFNRLLRTGEGLEINEQIFETRLAPRAPSAL